MIVEALAVEAARRAVELLGGFFVKAGDGAAQAVGKGLFEWLKGKLTGSAHKALDDLEKSPRDGDNQADLRKRLREALEEDPELLRGLRSVLDSLPKHATAQGGLTATVTGDGNITNQASGTGHTITTTTGKN
jgi:hypothetical protein